MLKNISLSILCAFFLSFNAEAQFSVDDDTLFTDGYVAAFTDLGAHTYIRNNTPDTQDVVWTRITNTLPNGWTSAICDINTCHGVTVSTQEFRMVPSYAGELSFHFYTGLTKGIGKMVIRLAKKSNPSYYIDVFVNCQAYGLNVNSINNSTFQITPNPASNFITLGNEQFNEGDFEISNLLGEKVMNSSFTGNQKIDVSTLSKGIYFITVKNNASMATSKLIIE